MNAKILVLLMLSLTSASLFAQWQSEAGPVPDTEWRKSQGDFGAMLVVTDKYEEFLKSWKQPSSEKHTPSISLTSRVRRGGKITAFIIFMNCKAHASGNCDLEVDYKVLRPDSSIYAESNGVELWKAPKKPFNGLSRGAATLAFEVELDDPIGVYRIEAVVRDKVANYKLPLVQELQVMEK
jgi:hypothetical protein